MTEILCSYFNSARPLNVYYYEGQSENISALIKMHPLADKPANQRQLAPRA